MSKVGSRPVERDEKARLKSKAVYKTKLFTRLRRTADVAPAAVRLPAYQRPDGSSQQSVQPISEAQEEKYKPPVDKDLQKFLATRNNYLSSLGIEKEFHEMIKVILTRKNLPYNPYPGFVTRFRDKAEGFHMKRHYIFLEHEIANTRVSSGGFPYLFKTEGQTSVWGLENVLKSVDPGRIHGYQWLMEDLTPSYITLEYSPQYSNQVTMSLCGSAVFHGSYFEMPFEIIIRAEYFIVGQDSSEGIKLFAKSVRKDIHQLYRKKHHVFLGVSLTQNDSGKTWWTYEDILEKQEAFEGVIQEITLLCNYIRVKCIFKLDPNIEYYVLGEKQYGLNFVAVKPNNKTNQSMTCYTELPMSTLHEGVLFNHAQALSYLSAFAKRPDLKQSDNSNNGAKDDRESHTKVLLGGFRFSNKDTFDPFVWQILAPIQSNFQQKIANLSQDTHLVEMLLFIIQLYHMARPAYENIIVHVATVLKSNASKIAHLQLINQAIQYLIEAYSGLQLDVIEQLLVQYQEEARDIFLNHEIELPPDMQIYGKAILHKLERIKQLLIKESDSYDSSIQASKELAALKQYTLVAQVQLSESTLRECRPLLEFIEDLKEQFVPELRNRQHFSAPESNFVHGKEGKNVRLDKAVLNIDACISQDNAPLSIAKESVLFKYLTDTHLDEVWDSFLMDLLHGPNFPANPYPRCVSLMRQCALRMSLCYEEDETLLKAIIHGNERVEKPQQYVYHIPGCDVHGPVSALKVLDENTFFQIAPLAERFLQKDYPERKSLFKIAISSAFVGNTVFAGRLSPYLLELVIHEHCYIRGPDGCVDEAIQIYSQIAHDHFQQLSQKADIVLLGFQMGQSKSDGRWTVEDVIQRKKTFLYNFEKNCHAKEAMLIKGFVKYDWRYLPVVKHLMFHYINTDETRFEKFFPPFPTFYMNVFTSADEAAFHFQYGGPPDQSDPFNVSNCRAASRDLDKQIIEAIEKQNWMAVHRALVTKNLINKGTVHILEGWRMLHSVAGQLEYVISLGQSIQDLLEYCLEQQNAPRPNSFRESREDDEMLGFTSPVARRIGSVDLQHLNQMTLAYQEKVMAVCLSHVTMAPANLSSILREKFDAVLSMDMITNQINLKTEAQTITTLSEISEILQALQDATSADVHAVSPSAKAAVASIVAEEQLKPKIIQSVDVDHHHATVASHQSYNHKNVDILPERDIRLAYDF